MLGLSSSTRGDHPRQRRNRKYYKDSCLIIGSCCSKLGRFYRLFGCRHITPLLLLVAYTLLGAVILQYVESSQEQDRERERLQRLDALRNATAWDLVDVLRNDIMSDDTKQMQTRDLVRWYEKQLGLDQQPVVHWDMWGALFYVGTVYTTIGYGNISPSTTVGRLVTVFYAMFGIPLVLAILNDLGQLMRQGINRSWQRLVNFRRSRRLPSSSNKQPELGIVTSDDDQDDSQEPPPIPISVALSLTLGWVLLCSGIFCLWETNWSYGTSLWFFFISLSTIGLGDVVPEKPHYMIANFGFVIIGLCLVSMTLGVIQQRIEQFLYRMMKLIRQEYEAATDQGRAPASAARLLEKAWRKQPWHVRLMAPHLLSHNAQSRLDRCAVRMVRGHTFRSVSRDLTLFKDDQQSRHVACCQPQQKYSNSEYPLLLPPATQRHFCDNSTQTDRGLAFFDLLLLENSEKWTSSSRKSSTTERQDLFLSKCPTVRDVAIQACIRVQTVHTAVGDSKNRKRSKSAAKRAEDADTQTTIVFDGVRIERVEKMVQTDDSYLRLASKLEALRNNRADSLAIMVTPGARRPSLPQTDSKDVPVTKQRQTSVKV